MPHAERRLTSHAGHTEVAAMLIQAGANVHIRDDRGRTPLLAAAFKNRVEIGRLLIARGADVNIQEAQGGTPLHMAATMGIASLSTCCYNTAHG